MSGWQDKKAYAYTRDLSAAGWAFEFLRRNKEYRVDFAKAAKLRQRRREKYGVGNGGHLRWRSDREFLIKLDEGSVTSDPDWRDATSTGTDGCAWIYFEDFFQLKWGLAQPIVDPSVAPIKAPRFRPGPRFPMFPDWRDVESFFVGEDPSESYEAEVAAHVPPFGQRPGAAVVVFDLTAPLTGQIRKAEEQLRSRQASQTATALIGKGHGALHQFSAAVLLKWLRVLDGVTAGAKKAVIWRTLFGKKSDSGNPTATVNDCLRPARSLVAGRYRLLAVSKIEPMV